MWGARASGRAPPVPRIYEKMVAFVNGLGRPLGYGDDMDFLERVVRPLCNAKNVCHHSAAERGSFLAGRAASRRGYAGGQPINARSTRRPAGIGAFLGCPPAAP
ncbi:hypothetical protein JL720_15696 [Aureococcus anophagefferens]|nr:hypothetical protein JL720_15696 [Aureococcus anophagefferens]